MKIDCDQLLTLYSCFGNDKTKLSDYLKEHFYLVEFIKCDIDDCDCKGPNIEQKECPALGESGEIYGILRISIRNHEKCIGVEVSFDGDSQDPNICLASELEFIEVDEY